MQNEYVRTLLRVLVIAFALPPSLFVVYWIGDVIFNLY